MMKRKIDVRLDGDLIDWLDGYAARRRWNRTQALTEVLVNFKNQEDDRERAQGQTALGHE